MSGYKETGGFELLDAHGDASGCSGYCTRRTQGVSRSRFPYLVAGPAAGNELYDLDMRVASPKAGLAIRCFARGYASNSAVRLGLAAGRPFVACADVFNQNASLALFGFVAGA